jgi:hypothetical protein
MSTSTSDPSLCNHYRFWFCFTTATYPPTSCGGEQSTPLVWRAKSKVLVCVDSAAMQARRGKRGRGAWALEAVNECCCLCELVSGSRVVFPGIRFAFVHVGSHRFGDESKSQSAPNSPSSSASHHAPRVIHRGILFQPLVRSPPVHPILQNPHSNRRPQ